ncbi:MAG: hypothetical protein WCO84_08155, partial [bacterium]
TTTGSGGNIYGAATTLLSSNGSLTVGNLTINTSSNGHIGLVCTPIKTAFGASSPITLLSNL